MNILILGSGGREHSLAWAIKQNPKCDNIFVAPGNAGIAQIAECISIDILNAIQIVKSSVVLRTSSDTVMKLMKVSESSQ